MKEDVVLTLLKLFGPVSSNLYSLKNWIKIWIFGYVAKLWLKSFRI